MVKNHGSTGFRRLAAVGAGSLIVVLAVATAAGAVTVVDQQNDYGPTEPVLGIGGVADQLVAQVVTVGRDGDLVEVHLAAGCLEGSMILEIRDLDGDLPGSTVLLRQTVSLPRARRPSDFQRIVLDPPLTMRRGERFAMVLDSADGVCAVAPAPTGDTYSGGEAFYSTPAPVRSWFPTMPERDLGFKTVVETVGPRGRLCLQGMPDGPIPFRAHLPICSCLEDYGARELRCGFFHPDFFLIRTVPFPIPPEQEFVVRWHLLPFEALGGTLSLREILPQELGHDGDPTMIFQQGAQAGRVHEFKYIVKAPDSSVLLPISTEIALSGPDNSDEVTWLQSMWTVKEPDGQ